MFKTSLLKYLKICMDLSVASSLQGNKITADKIYQVPEIRNITEPTLHACASHHSDHKNTWHAPLERCHGIQQNTCRAHAHMQHTLIMAKMTNAHNLIRISTKHYEALLQQHLGHGENLTPGKVDLADWDGAVRDGEILFGSVDKAVQI